MKIEQNSKEMNKKKSSNDSTDQGGGIAAGWVNP
jgi:hypothetical protein